jgi:hypothetical protein
MLQRRNEALERALHSSPAVAGGMAAAGASAVQQREQAAEQHTTPALGLTSAPWWLDAAVQVGLMAHRPGCCLFMHTTTCCADTSWLWFKARHSVDATPLQAQLASELGIDGPLVFSVREDAPITLTQQQVRMPVDAAATEAHTLIPC